jgi:hypothetical protein
MSSSFDECYLVMIEDRDGGENYWNFVFCSQVSPLIWRCLTDHHVRFLLKHPEDKEEIESYHKNYVGYTDDEITQIFDWFMSKSPYHRGGPLKWYSYSIPAPTGAYRFLGVRHFEERTCYCLSDVDSD